MKKVITFAILLLCATAAYAQDAGQTALDYGTRVNIESEYETSLDLSYRQDPNTYHMLYFSNYDHAYPVWSPKENRIFYTDHTNILSVPTTGGKPRLEYEGILFYPYNGKRFVLTQSIGYLAGISPDGNKLYFIQNLIGDGSGAEITITEHLDETGKLTGWGSSIKGGLPVVQCLDLVTGTVTTVVRNTFESSLSRSGKYLEYFTWDTKTVRVRDLETSEDWSLPIASHSVSFTDNDQNFLYTVTADSTSKFFKIPVRGGEPQEVAALTANTENVAYSFQMDCTPKGDWTIYSFYTGEPYKEGNFSKTVTKLRLSNISTGQTMEVVPFSKFIDAYWPRFSPDGKQIYYIRCDWRNNEYALYIKDIYPFMSSDPTVSVAEATPTGFSLTGNYPNPFNPSTRIAFTIPSSGTAHLSVYDVTGRKVRDLVSSTLSAGTHEMVWDGRDDSGAPVSSGTYIARLKMGNLSAAHRMLLVK